MVNIFTNKKTLSAIGLFLGISLVTSTQAITYTYNIDTPNGNDLAGDIRNINTQYYSDSNRLSWKSNIRSTGGEIANGFTLVLSDGANPQSHINEYAIFYGDFETGNLTTYVYDGNKSSKNIWKNGEFIQSFTSVINVDQSANGEVTFDFSIDVSDINSYIPSAGKEKTNDWDGAQFNENIGVWYHPFISKKEILYNKDGSIAFFKRGNTSYYDTGNKATDVPEPGVLILTGLGMLGMLGARYRRKT